MINYTILNMELALYVPCNNSPQENFIWNYEFCDGKNEDIGIFKNFIIISVNWLTPLFGTN